MTKRLRLIDVDTAGSADQRWCWVVEPDGGRHAPRALHRVAADGAVLTRRPHGYAARLTVLDRSGATLPMATLLRAAHALGGALEACGDGLERPLTVELGPAGTATALAGAVVRLDGHAVAQSPSHHPLNEAMRALLMQAPPPLDPQHGAELPWRDNHVLFFESLMSSDLPHNDRELSQGVLHMASTLRGTPSQPRFANVKMPITGVERPLTGVESLTAALAGPPIALVCITLLEGYFEGVRQLIRILRGLGCNAHIAVGGVMPTLTPEHVAAHLEEVSFVCRGAGEYFVPRLARILGHSDVTQPFDDAQRQALLAMDGLLAIDRSQGALIAANPGRIVEVASLDAVDLDLSHLERRHIEGGIEISTARGCIHHCSFCTVMGRHSYTARSVDGVFDLLDTYQARFDELYGSEIPHNAYRVHISDDDFACDTQRAIETLERLLATPFRLSSVQVSIADLCLRDGQKLLPKLDPRFLSVLDPACFADHNKPVPTSDYVADHRSRNWSSYLQIGVETFCDAELTRLAKGYRREHIRAVVAALAARGVHMDAYFIASNSETRAEDLAASVMELARLKLRHPIHFHVRFPIVPHLVSYFPSATHKLKQRRGERHTMRLLRYASVPNHPELDYPFVDHDIPQDRWVSDAVDAGFLQDARFYTASLERLRSVWSARLQAPADKSELTAAERRRGEQLVRLLDDAPRKLTFELLRDARQAEQRGHSAGTARALEVAEAVLGPKEPWLSIFRRSENTEVPRLVVIPTWQCELRCRYCYIPKQDGRVMTQTVMDRALDLLLSSGRDEVILQFFGGEPLVEYDLIRHAIEHGSAEATRVGKRLSFVLSSNGWSLDADKLAWLRQHPVKLELSLDGDPGTQNKYRPALLRTHDSYLEGIAPRADAILASGLRYDVIMVVHPGAVERLRDNFFHISALGFERIQINFALGVKWTQAQKSHFAEQLFAIGKELRRRWNAGQPIMMVNLENPPLPIRLNAEITVDYDGTIYGGNAFLHETEHKQKFAMGQLDDLGCFDRYWCDAPINDELLAWSYPPDVTRNNLAVGRIMTSFMRWMQAEPIGISPRTAQISFGAVARQAD